jgi:hypothetical protein
MSNGLSGISSLAYQGTNAPTPPNITVQNVAPLPTNYQGFSIGDFWVYRISKTSNNSQLWVLMGLSGNVANWVLLSGSVGPLLHLTPNIPGATVFPTLTGNINIWGDGTTITTTSNPSTNTITISAIGGEAANSFPTDSGTAAPVAGVLNIKGLAGGNISTSAPGASNTVAIAITGTTNNAIQVGNVTGSLTSLTVVNDGVLITSNTGIPSLLPNGTTGQVLTATTGGAPSWASISADGAVTELHADDGNNALPTVAGLINIHGGNNIGTTAAVANTVTINVTGTTNHALQIGNATGSLTSLAAATNGQLPIGSTGANPTIATLTAGTGISITNGAGSITIATAKPYFQASLTTGVTNVTGDATQYTILWDTVVVDTASGFSTLTGQYTVPTTGFWLITAGAFFTNFNASHNQLTFIIYTTGVGPWYPFSVNAGNVYMPGDNDGISGSGSILIPLTAGNTVQVEVIAAGSTKTVGIHGSGVGINYFSGVLIQ